MNRSPNQGEVRRTLAAAADVLFSDGVSVAFLDQWAEETVFLLEADSAARAIHSPRRLG
jgi:hypothetical protein